MMLDRFLFLQKADCSTNINNTIGFIFAPLASAARCTRVQEAGNKVKLLWQVQLREVSHSGGVGEGQAAFLFLVDFSFLSREKGAI